jgi:hypothetical protein
MTLDTWGTQFGKSIIVGASLIIFDDVDYNGLRSHRASDIKKFSSGSGMQIDRKGMGLVMAGGGQIFMSGNKNFSYKSSPDLRTDEGWNRRLVVIPIEEKSNFEPIRKDADLPKKFLADAPCVIGWALAMPDSVMVGVGHEAAMITQSVAANDDTLFTNIRDFLCECVRLDFQSSEKGGSGANRAPHTLRDAFFTFCEERDLVVPTGRFELLEGLRTVLRQFKVDRFVQSKKGRNGWEYFGLILSKNKGQPITVAPFHALEELRNTPLCTIADATAGVVPFEYKGVYSNSEILALFKPPSRRR